VKREKYVYDPVCDAPHSYTGNGLINHNCVLWIDEIEKSLSGTKSSNFSDGGTLARVFGTLLTSMEEGMEGVVTIATANDIQALPPELIRRFNEVLFVDLPQPEERKEIFEIHFKKRGRNVEDLNLNMDELVKATHKFTGSEIEKAVKESIARAFRLKREDVIQEDVLGAVKDTKPIAKIMKDKIDAIRDWARDKARYASSLAEAAASPYGQKVYTSSGKELDFDSELDEIDELGNDNKRFED
jgi:MoxR-like ATPase